ncbi:P-loop NTPase fold protein [Cronbergia sp. UHCC 0137]|uniref:P-loop NTPase fold protein n=1 Tax=Cronbergia sp. UHCC 0137 TaxID=3110239 RepID=UPI002B1FAA54|nr:P-loop NTPase fold protein [Cronbergia sp. UHCC 0137]MEA5618472.1 P-loop NTPase fold protein [Cronbergia sp. UHCC 0137]
MTENTNRGIAGLNRKDAESILKKFLDNENYRVLAVNGKWGVGKTHLVQTFLNEHLQDYYLYASVFGISSIEQLKVRILANYKKNLKSDNSTNKSNILNYINKYITDILEWFNRILPKLEKTPKLDLSFSKNFSIPVAGSLISVAGDLGLEILFNLNVRQNSIICIDDLERKSKLSLEEMLGFVEYLVQERKCKIILIYNEDNLVKIDKEALDDYREKVIDREFTLNPTVEENLDFIFKDYPDIEVIKSVLINAGTNNIRVIRKTRWLIDELIPFMKNWEVSLRHQIIRNSIVINLSKLDTEFCKKFPNIKDIKSTLSIDPLEYMGTDQKANDIRKFQMALEKKTAIQGQQLLNLYFGYSDLEEVDELIIQLVETSLSKSAELKFIEKGYILNQKEKRNQILEKFNELSNKLYRFKYYNSFADNEQDMIKGIVTFLKENHLQLSIPQFEQVERFTLILGLDISEYEKPLLETILTKIFEQNSYDNLSGFTNKLSKYPDLEASFNEKIKEYHQTLDITTAVKNIMNRDPYSRSPRLQQDIEFLNSRTVDEYSQWLEQGHPELFDMVKWFLKSAYQSASQKLEQAIRILAECSKINKIRAKFLYDIDIDNPTNNHPRN